MASPPPAAAPAPKPLPNAAGASRWQDIVAGLCVAGLLIPEAVAYAGLARLPAVHALSAAMAGLAIYALFGRSRFAIVAPTSSTAVLSAAAATSIGASAAATDAGAYATAFMALVLLAGLLLMLLAWARQGQLSAFVSRPVLRGFAFALAITIVIKQLPDAFGFVLPSEAGGDPFHALLFAVTHVAEWHGPTVAVALCAGALIAGLRRWPRLPGSLLVIAGAIAAARWLDLHALGVAEVGAIGRPGAHFELPRLPLAEWLTAAEMAFGLVVLIFAESWGSMRTMALAAGDTLDADRELMVLGACNVGAALLQGMPVGAGFSATSANAAAGAGSRWAGAAALAAVALAVAFALPAVRLLPRPVLAVAVISALWHALSVRPLVTTWRMNRDRMLIVGAVAAVLLFGVLYGMLVAIALSVLAAMRRFSLPVVHELGELDGTRNFVAIDGHSGALATPGVLVLRPEEPLFFASAERIAAAVVERLEGRDALRVVVLSLEESSDLDSTAVECLLELKQDLHGSGRALVLARVKEPVRELLGRLDPAGLGRADGMFWSVADAVQAARGMQAPKERSS
jgi:MFS superfamily sulfate permease-like transporter